MVFIRERYTPLLLNKVLIGKAFVRNNFYFLLERFTLLLHQNTTCSSDLAKRKVGLRKACQNIFSTFFRCAG